MPQREIEPERIAEHSKQRHRAGLVVFVLGVLERHVEKHALLGPELRVEFLRNRPLGKRQRGRVGHETARVPPEHIAGKLIEHEDRREHALWTVEPGGRNAGLELVIRVAPKREATVPSSASSLRNQSLGSSSSNQNGESRRSWRSPSTSLLCSGYALAGAAIAALIKASASGKSQSAGPTRRPISRPSRSMSSVAGMPTVFSAANSLPLGSV